MEMMTYPKFGGYSLKNSRSARQRGVASKVGSTM